MFIAHVISPHMHKSHMRQNTEKQSVVLSFISKAEGYLPENLHTECEESDNLAYNKLKVKLNHGSGYGGWEGKSYLLARKTACFNFPICCLPLNSSDQGEAH